MPFPRLLQVGASWFPYQFSGLERYYAELVVRLPALGTEVIGVVSDLHDPPPVAGLRLISLGREKRPAPLKFFTQRRVVKACLRDGIDLVVSHCTPSLFPSLSHLGEQPLISHFHGPRYLERKLEGATAVSAHVSKYIERSVYDRTQRFITLSQYMKNMLVQTYAVPEEQVSIVPGGVNLDRFRGHASRDDVRKHLNLPSDRRIVLAVRRLARRMGLHNLVDAIADVVQAYPEILLLIAGKGPLQRDLEEYVRSRNLDTHVRLLGPISDTVLPLLYCAADFSIVPSVAYEGFGLPLIESLAAGTPVLATPTGAIPEILAPLSNALLLESDSPPHIAEGIRDVLSGRRTLPTSQMCEAHAAKYGWPTVIQKVHAVYRDALGDR